MHRKSFQSLRRCAEKNIFKFVTFPSLVNRLFNDTSDRNIVAFRSDVNYFYYPELVSLLLQPTFPESTFPTQNVYSKKFK